MIRLVGFSGPPRSGKDTIAGHLSSRLAFRGNKTQILAHSTPMRMAVYAYLGLSYSDEHYHENKDIPIDVGHGRQTTIRREMISLSESHVKARFGHDWWGHNLINRIDISDGIVLVTDMGFQAEHDLFMDAFGPENCAWMHLYRDGTSWDGDSRSYVGKGSMVLNNHSPDGAATYISYLLRDVYKWENI